MTIADVARAAGVSPTTVSHSLNGLGKVDPRTRQRVKDVAAELRYRPSVRAQRLRRGRSHSIALLSSMPTGVSGGFSRLGFFTEIAMGCAETALLHGYALTLVPPVEDREHVARLDIDGAIVLEPAPTEPLTAELDDRGLPYVTIDAPASSTCVDLHHRQAAELILDHLVAVGARSIGLLLGSSGRASQTVFRKKYQETVERLGAEPVIRESPEADGEEGAHATTARLLAEHPQLDALCVPIDAFASGALRAATAAGRSIGEDLLLATRYDGLRAQTASPPLTAVDLNLGEISRAAVTLLLSGLGAVGGAGAVEAAAPSPPRLVVRASTVGSTVSGRG